MMIVEESKYVTGAIPADSTRPGHTVTTTLYAQAALVPIATRVSMPVVRWRAARQADR